MRRRSFLTSALAGAACFRAALLRAEQAQQKQVMTVTGSVAADELGVTLSHEHVMVDFVGASRVSSERYESDEVVKVVLPHLERLRAVGCQTLVECTPAYLGRDPQLLKRLSNASGLQLLTNTGYYGAREGKFLPGHAFHESAAQLAQRWLGEWRDGIDSTEIRPGFIKIGVDSGSLTQVNRKLVRAAAHTHLESGLTIACHTGDGTAAMEELAILDRMGVSPSAWIWVHAQNESDVRMHERAAAQGGWIEFDGIRPDTIEQHVRLVRHMKDQGLLNRTLISHDAGWYSVGEPGGGAFRAYDTLFSNFLPALRTADFSQEELHQLTVRNPADAFRIRVRRK